MLALIAELRGPRVAEMVQLGLEYAPQPPFNSGRPDTAPAEVLEAVNARTAAGRAERRVRFDAWAAPIARASMPEVSQSMRVHLSGIPYAFRCRLSPASAMQTPFREGGQIKPVL